MHGYNRVHNVHANGIMCTQKFVYGIDSSCKNNLNLPVFSSSFFLLCAWVAPLLVHCIVMVILSLRCAGFFVCFNGSQFCSRTINQTSFSKSKGWFSFILLCRWEKYRRTGLLGLHIYDTNMS